MSSQPLVDERSAAFARFAARVIEVLNEAVEARREEGETLASIADRMGCHRSILSRILNGTNSNVTLRTVSDVLWATEFEPNEFSAEPIEDIEVNWSEDVPSYVIDGEMRLVVPTLNSNRSYLLTDYTDSKLRKFPVEEVML